MIVVHRKIIRSSLLLAPIAALLFLAACRDEVKIEKIVMEKVEPMLVEEPPRIDTFSAFPPEIDGCSCYFAADAAGFKQKAFIYMNDFANLSIMKIDGRMTRFTTVERKQVDSTHFIMKAISPEYELILEAEEGAATGEETSLHKGKIILSNKKGMKLTVPFFGECGC